MTALDPRFRALRVTSNDAKTVPSIVLLGSWGAGKSSLAVIARSALRLNSTEIEDVFQRETGLQRSAYRKLHGAAELHRREIAIIQEVLAAYSTNCIIVCPSDYVEEAGLQLFRRYGKEHPVIFVQRSSAATQEYLKLQDTEKLQKALDSAARAYRHASNYEFFNVDDLELYGAHAASHDRGRSLEMQKPHPLRLKYTEASFLRLVNNILRPLPRLEATIDGNTFSSSPVPYSYLHTVSVCQVTSQTFNVDSLDCGADACQLSVDVKPTGDQGFNVSELDTISRGFAIVTRSFRGPLIFHVPYLSSSENGHFDRSYVEALRHGLRLGADYATIFLNDSTRKYIEMLNPCGRAKFIGDYHESDPGQDGWSSQRRWDVYHQARELGFCGVRLTQPAQTLRDNREVAAFVVEAGRLKGKQPFLVAYNTGRFGRSSRCFNQCLTPVVSQECQAEMNSSRADDDRFAPDLTLQQCQRALYASFNYDPMNYFIIGLDVSYSLSPVLHNSAHQFFGMPHQLTAKSTSTLDGLYDLTYDHNFGGLTIAQGYKLSIFPFVSVVSRQARTIGAINTVIPIRAPFNHHQPLPSEFWINRNRAGPVSGLYGDNLDWVGIAESVLQNLSPANVITNRTTGLVIGAGGMARAAVYALLKIGVREIVMYNRTLSKGVELARHFAGIDLADEEVYPASRSANLGHSQDFSAQPQIRVLESLEDGWCSDIAQPTIVLSCIPASKTSNDTGANFQLPAQWMQSPSGGVVVDMNYLPFTTPLLRQVRQQSHKGWVAVDGLQNLAAQASAQFEMFTGRRVPKYLMRKAALQHFLVLHQGDQEVLEIVHKQLKQLAGGNSRP